MFGINRDRFRINRIDELRRQMSSEAEGFFRARLRNTKRPPMAPARPPADNRTDPFQIPPQNGHKAAPRPPARQRSPSTLVPVEADDRGHVRRQSVANLVRRLTRLTESFRREDVLLDLSHVKSASSEFVLLLKVFRDRLKVQQRCIYICGPVDPAVRELDDHVVNSLLVFVPTCDHDW